MVDLALKILLDDRTRLLTTVCGVGFSVMLVLVQWGIFLGMLDNASATITNAEADLWITARNTPNVDFANTFPESHLWRVRAAPGVAEADNLIVWFVTVALPSGAKDSALVYALEDFTRWGLPWNVAEGNPIDLRRGRYVFLDDSARRRFGPFAVGEYREFQGLRLKIIGRTRGAKSFTTNPIAFVDYHVAQALAPDELRGRATYILVRLEDGANARAVQQELGRRLPYNDVHTRDEWAARCRSYWVESTGLGMSMFLTVFLGALVGVVVVAQTLYTATMEYRKEFATVKAIGGTSADIYRIIAKQATLAAIAGFAVGAGLARAVRPVLERLDLKLILTPAGDAVTFAATVALCLAAGTLSYRRIAALDPAMVFRD